MFLLFFDKLANIQNRFKILTNLKWPGMLVFLDLWQDFFADVFELVGHLGPGLAVRLLAHAYRASHRVALIKGLIVKSK